MESMLSSDLVGDLVGLVGVAVILLLYLLVQTDRITTDHYRFSLGNALGAACILFSLTYQFNLPSFVIETAWLAISLWGFIHSWRKRNGSLKGMRQ
jgi:amino acid permease